MSYRMFRTFSVKIWVCVLYATGALAAPSGGPRLTLDIIDLAAISRMTPQQLEMLAEGLAMEEIMRTKRSSVQAALTSVVSKASSGLQGKVGLLGQASAGAASFIAAASSKTGGGGDEHGYSYEPAHDSGHKVDFWGLKKSILYTLFQAVKAITGGVTILKGQLIKGGGALAATLGKVISVKGDAVSNLGKKIVSSAALSSKKQHSSSHGPVYGPPPAHVDFPPSAYGPPTAPAHYVHSAPSAHSAPTGFAAHKYPAHLDDGNILHGTGRGKLNGLHAGLILLTPVGHEAESHTAPAPHTPLEPPSSLLHTAFSAIKGAFSHAAPTSHSDDIHDHPPPPVPAFKPMAWNAVNSYGEPAALDTYPDYNAHSPYDVYAHSKHSVPQKHHQHLTPEKIQKIKKNIEKVVHMYNNQRSSEDMPHFNGLEILKGNQLPLLPTPVVTDAEVGVLAAELQPSEDVTTTSTTSTTTPRPDQTTESPRRKKDIKFILRGNRIVQV